MILTPRFTEDSQALWRAAGKRGWSVERLTTWRVPDELRHTAEPVLYLEALFGPTLALEFGLQLLEPPLDWLPNLPAEYRQRQVELTTFGQVRDLSQPTFLKPPNDKSFPAKVYTADNLPAVDDDTTPVLASQIVEWEVEYRAFILDRQIRAMSIYLRHAQSQRENDFTSPEAEQSAAKSFLQTVLSDERVMLPKACVVDVGIIAGRGWAVVEQNTAWGSGLYGCDPHAVLDVLRYASVPATSQG